ncbi:hypothetical protein ACFQBQ_07620 [Granulicella cerasi]|uniref:Uncharacterized protein n=1 Tax=Granulicella cerasi TaxID=741063 RepID=A0ABW1ZAJ7_9BACT|nr:hypothetical protein [Granulicella cerasi]
MSKVANKWIDLFQAGDYSVDGKGTFTESDLDQIVNNYDPAHHEAPSTIGHIKPNDKAPAYGWWSKLRRVGTLLQGQMSTVQPEFEEALERKLFKKRSVGLRKGDNGWMLHHVAWLGAQAPHIKGLADLVFESANEQTVEIEFSEETKMAYSEEELKQVGDSLWDRIKGKLGVDVKAADQPVTKAFSEDDMKAAITAAVTPFNEKIAGLEAKFSERETKIATVETQQRADAAIARVKSKGAWVPAMEKAGLSLVFSELAKSEDTVTFGEGEQKVEGTALELFTQFMEGLGKIVPTGRAVQGEPAAAATREYPANADPNSVAFAEAVNARAQEKNISYEVAMGQIAAERPELTKPGNASTGAV